MERVKQITLIQLYFKNMNRIEKLIKQKIKLSMVVLKTKFIYKYKNHYEYKNSYKIQ